MQVGYRIVQSLQRRSHFWAFVSAQHAALCFFSVLIGVPYSSCSVGELHAGSWIEQRFPGIVDQLLNTLGPSLPEVNLQRLYLAEPIAMVLRRLTRMLRASQNKPS